MIAHRWTGLVVAGLLLAACGGGGGATGDDSGTAQTPPVVVPQQHSLAVVFPPPRSAVEGDSVIVRGTAEGLTDLAVNGIPATVNGTTWTAEVPLGEGANTVAVVGAAADGSRIERVIEVDRAQSFLRQAQDVVFDERRDRLYVMEGHSHTLLAVETDTGDRTPVHQWTDDPAPEKWWWAVKPLEIDAANNTIYVLRPGGSLDTVHLPTGKVTRVVDSFFVQPRALALDHDTGTLYIADRFQCRLFEWRPEMVLPEIVSDIHTGGTDLHFRDIYFDAARKRVVIAGQGRWGGAVIAVDMDNGFRYDLEVGLPKPDTLSYDPVQDLAVLSGEPGLHTWTPAQDKVSARIDADNVKLIRWSSIAVRPGTSEVFLVSTDHDGVFRMDRNDGRILPLSAEQVGEGVPLGSREGESVADVAWDDARGRTVTVVEYREPYQWNYPVWLEDTQHAIVAVDGRTGDRTVVAADPSERGKKQVVEPRGDGPLLGELGAVAVDPVTGRLLALSESRACLLVIDPETGDRTELACTTQPGVRWTAMAVDPEGRRATVATSDGFVLLIHIDTGDVETVATQGGSPIAEIAILPGEDRVFVADGTSSRIDTIGLRNGRRDPFAVEPQGRPVLDLHADPANDRVVVVCPGELGSLDRVGRFTPVAAGDPGGFFPADSRRVCVDPSAGCAFVATSQERAGVRGLFAVDLATGQCVIASKE